GDAVGVLDVDGDGDDAQPRAPPARGRAVEHGDVGAAREAVRGPKAHQRGAVADHRAERRRRPLRVPEREVEDGGRRLLGPGRARERDREREEEQEEGHDVTSIVPVRARGVLAPASFTTYVYVPASNEHRVANRPGGMTAVSAPLSHAKSCHGAFDFAFSLGRMMPQWTLSFTSPWNVTISWRSDWFSNSSAWPFSRVTGVGLSSLPSMTRRVSRSRWLSIVSSTAPARAPGARRSGTARARPTHRVMRVSFLRLPGVSAWMPGVPPPVTASCRRERSAPSRKPGSRRAAVMTDADFAWQSALDLRHAILRKEVSPVDVVRAALDRLAAVEPALNAFVTPTPDAALDAARRAEQAIVRGEATGPLAGLPI